MDTLPPVTVAVIGADGAIPLKPGTVETPANQPNIVIQIITPLMAVSVRAVNVFLTVFLSLTGIGNLAHAAIGDAIPSINFHSALMFAGLAALGEAGKSILTITTGMEKKYPLGTGSI